MKLNNLFDILRTLSGGLGKLLLSLRTKRTKKSVLNRIVHVEEDFYTPDNEEWLNSRIPVGDEDRGHLEFRRLSKADKTKWILKNLRKHTNEYEPDSPIYTKKGKKGYWYVPCYTSIKRDLRENRRVNRYLNHQHSRIKRAIERKNLELAFRIFTTLLQKSWAFRVSCINSAVKGWYYQHNAKYLKSWLTTLDMDLRKLNFDVKFWRVYIPKGDTGKFRPLGVPSLSWRVILYMHSSFLNLLIPETIDTPDKPQQFGFLPGRNARQAWITVLQRIRNGRKLYEFDLDGCFNRISCKHVTKYLEDIGFPSYYIAYLEGLLSSSPLQLKDMPLLEEREIVKGKGGRLWKYGLPQGFSISPLLTVFVIDRAMKKAGATDFVMYADDGILTLPDKTNPRGFSSDQERVLNQHGMFLSDKKKKDGTDSCRWIDDEFTFLGVKFSITKWSFLVPHKAFVENMKDFESIGLFIGEVDIVWDNGVAKGIWIPADLVNDRIWNILLYKNEPGDTSFSLSKKTKWDWEIDPSCFALTNSKVDSRRNWSLILKYVEGNPFIQRCAGTLLFLDAQKESTLSSRALLHMRDKFMRGTTRKRVRMESMFLHIPKTLFELGPRAIKVEPEDMGIIRPYLVTHDPDLDNYSRQHSDNPTYLQRIIIERRQRRLLASWGKPILLADTDLAQWVRPEDWEDERVQSKIYNVWSLKKIPYLHNQWRAKLSKIGRDITKEYPID